MTAEGDHGGNAVKSKKRRHQYLTCNKPSKGRPSWSVRPGLQGFFITCDGGRESQAKSDALKLLDKIYEELVQEKGSAGDIKPSNEVLSIKAKRTVFKYSDEEASSSSSDSDQGSGNENGNGGIREGECGVEEEVTSKKEVEEVSTKKRRLETDQDNASKAEEISQTRGTTIDKILEAEIKELGDKEKARFAALDSGCNGVVFIRMHKECGPPTPSELVEYLMNKAASTKQQMSRFILRLLPVELTCYASPEEITKVAEPLIKQHFPTTEYHPPIKFAVLYEARANAGVDRLTIIDTVAKLVPQPHKVDLSNPDKTIVVQITKTICMIGIVHKFKQLSKYNLQQLTGYKPH